METSNILTADILDILFEGRNKMYGAYELRKTYNNRITKALLLTGALLVLVVLSSVFAGAGNRLKNDDITVKDMSLAEVKKEEPIVIPPPVKIKHPVQNQQRFVQPVVVNDRDVDNDKPVEDLKDDAAISNQTIESDIKDAAVQAPVEEKSSQVIEAPKVDDNNKVFTSVQNEAEFPGGSAAWTKYVQKSLEGFNPSDNGALPGKYNVIVRFIVSKDGSISNVQAETSFGYGMEELAIKAIEKGPKWKPALQNGINVNAYRRQPITFVVNEE